jgi:class 3 adenylate cyclase/tetratricopeptide (TPR) repeat protein
MRCPACQGAIGADDKTCATCGASYAACPNCRGLNFETARFCSSCGERLERAAALGERKVVTVLFADIVGSTELIGDADPEHALDRLPPAIARMGNAVNQLQGTIMRTMGDGLMVLFGVPHAQEDHAARACQAALTMLQSSHEHGIMLRIGIHSGEIIAGLTDEFTKEQSVYGAAVHLASRIEHMAGPGDVCITDATYRLVQPFFNAQSLGRQEVRGFARPIEVFRLLGVRTAATRVRDATAASYRGRSAELALLRSAFDEARGGRGKAIGISAPPGLGKSRLCFEFAKAERERGVPLLEAHASPYEHSGPLQPLIEFFRTYFRLSRHDSVERAQKKIASRVEAIVPEMRSEVPLLCDFLGVAGKSSPRISDPQVKRSRLLNFVRALVRDGVRTPTIIIVEDVHWLDEASNEVIATLIDVAAASRALIILTYRPTLKADWQGNPSFDEIRLSELNDDDIAILVRDALGNDPSIDVVANHVIERSGGNPFFAEELMRSLVDSGTLQGQPGSYLAPSELQVETLPATVQSVIGARIDRLVPTDKMLLQIGATIGREFPLSVLREVAGEAAQDVQQSLQRLTQLELIGQVAADDPSERYAFRHPLIQEVAYAMQLRARRVTLHGAAARAIERFHHNQLNEYAELIAHHYEAAKEPVQAATYAARSASWIGSTNARLATRSWQKVKILLKSQPRSPETDRLRMMASSQLVNLGWREGISAEEAAPLAEEAMSIARDQGDLVAEVLVLAGYGRMIVSTGFADRYVELVNQAFDISSRQSPSVTTLLQGFLCQACGHAGKLREALEAGSAALANVDKIEAAHEAIMGLNVERWLRSLRSRLLIRSGDIAAGKALIDELLSDPPPHADPSVQFIPHLASVELAWLTNDAALARRHANAIEQIARGVNIPYVAVYADACQGIALALEDNHVAANQRLEKAVRLAHDAFASLEFEAEMLAYLAEIELRAGQFEDARRRADEAIKLARKRGARLAECRAVIALAHALDGMGSQQQARAHFDRARTLIEDTGAEAYLSLLKCVERAGVG